MKQEPAASPELSFSPFFERSWASLHEALEDGQIDAERLRQVFVDFAPLPAAGESVFVGIDTSNLYRPEAETAADRTLVPIANLTKHTHAASPGWVMSHVVLLPKRAGQATFILDTARVASTGTGHRGGRPPTARRGGLVAGSWLASHHCWRPLVRFARFLTRLADVEACCLLRVKSNRVFYRQAPERFPGQSGSQSQGWGALSMPGREQSWRSG